MLLKLDPPGPPVVTWLQGHIEEIRMEDPPKFIKGSNEEDVRPTVEMLIDTCDRLKRIFLV